MADKYIRIISYGLIGESEDGSSYRHVIFEDPGNSKRVDYLVNQKQRPILWSDIEQLENGKTLPAFKGYIANFNGIDIVVLGDESLEDAYAHQKWKPENHKKIEFKEADRLRQESKGYCTNLTHKNAMEYSWHNIPRDVKEIRYRYYIGKGNYSWSMWYEIEG
jgi:hypothetical protein